MDQSINNSIPSMAGSSNSANISPSVGSTALTTMDAQKTEPGQKESDVEKGMEVELKQFYRSDPYDPWDDWCPDDIPINAADPSMTEKYAMIVRRQNDCHDGRGMIPYSITIQSPFIRDLLHRAFEDYKAISTEVRDLTFTTPFHEFFYRWDKIQNLIAEERDKIRLSHLSLLQQVIEPELRADLEAKEDLLKLSLISYQYLWTLFEPGTEVYSKIDQQDQMFIVKDTEYNKERRFFMLTCKFIDFDGSSFGYNTQLLAIHAFKGVMNRQELDVIPCSDLPDREHLYEKLTERGREFVKLTGVHFKAYAGLYIPKKKVEIGPRRKAMDHGRILIDARRFFDHNSDDIPRLKSLQDFDSHQSCSPTSDDVLTSFGHFLQSMIPRSSHLHETSIPPKPFKTDISDVRYCLCSPIVRGFNLKSKEWANFYVDQICDVSFSDDAFRRLVLPFDYKDLIKAFVAGQIADTSTFDDIIAGKGQGIIILLHGEPGVGKTLTAEAVAEEMRRPLYSISAGELGYTAGEVEENLETVLNISTAWNAVLLIDECDIFLEQRTVSDLNRNKLVAVFLRLLEYFKGVMFLTTNRVETFDVAFQSRIHLTINYPKLDIASRKHVWKTFIPSENAECDHRHGHSQITEADIDALANIELNGREIKNIVKTSRLISNQKKVPLNMDHVNTVLRVKCLPEC